ncbi:MULTISPECIES: DUF47 domain-containing protein [Thermoanaerobacterium]|uniref:Phosphate transport regulator n=2 Tax=Thermoanaerobacterium TaxID=28895 RepID=I3VRK9_THESW|nr:MULTISPECIES: DUF47 family protein [Thermoanaerobacterium]AFK85154.1 Putative phosphate transport regulator [Thermoanaerobacterium saccharolyticum JW/SL-YS485]ETO39758.1 putative phosphate transport regulator [Thermoanaerobacterium aotearoense SCUT27]
MGLFNWLFSKGVDFYKLLQEHSNLALKGVQALALYMTTGKDDDGEKVISIEKEADNKRKELIDELDSTFITPIEREDIYELSSAIDNILDYCETTVKEMEIYELAPTEELREMVDVILRGTELIARSVYNLDKDKKVAMDCALKAKKLENEMESYYRKHLAKLIKSDDIKYILKMREIYRHLNNCADKMDLAGEILGHILVKEI